MQHIFVYGSLLFPEIVEGLTGKSFETQKAVLKNFERHAVAGCDYPAILQKKNAEVKGVLLLNVDCKSLKILTFYEGDEYEQKTVEVESETKKINALVFVWKGENSVLLSEDWEEGKFKKESIKYYINKVVPETVKEFLNR